MNRQEIEKLLGGYATGTLTREERDALFAAALEDQQLFEELAREEPLRELLQDPIAKTRLRAALEQKPAAGYLRWLRPAAWAIPAVGLAALVVVMVMQRQETRPVMIAQTPALPRMGPVETVPSPVPQVLEKRQLPTMARPIKAAPADSLALAANEPGAAPAPLPVAAQGQTAGALSTQQVLGATAVVPLAPSPTAPPVARARASAVRLEAAGRLGGVGGFVAPSDARALFFGAPAGAVFQSNLVDSEKDRGGVRQMAQLAAAAKASAPQLGLRYSILRRAPNGQLTPVNPGEGLDAGDEIVLRMEPNDTGYLSVFEHDPDGAWRPLVNTPAERMAVVNVPQNGALPFAGSANKELFVVFTRQPQQTAYPVPEARLDQILNANPAEQVTYAVSTSTIGPAQTLAFPITLTHR
jgi:hypothetical protein